MLTKKNKAYSKARAYNERQLKKWENDKNNEINKQKSKQTNENMKIVREWNWKLSRQHEKVI